MSATDQADDIERRAEVLYAARSALAETQKTARRIGVAEILQFLNDPSRDLTMEEQRSLFTNPRLRADYRRLKSQVAVADIPMLAAASAGDVNARRFEGGSIKIHPSRVPDQIYVLLQFNEPSASARSMLLESAQGELVKRSLPAADAKGEVIMVLNAKDAADAHFLRIISDPTSSGSFFL